MKNLLIAALAAAVIPCFAQTSTSPPGSVMSSQGGRFVLGQLSSFRRDQFMLDTQSGRAWTLVCTKTPENDPMGCALWALQPVLYLDTGGHSVGVVPSATAAGAR